MPASMVLLIDLSDVIIITEGSLVVSSWSQRERLSTISEG
jgi:hypothetical protein